MKIHRLSRWILVTGAALIVASVTLMAVRYPWGMLLGDTSPLPDPKPLPYTAAPQDTDKASDGELHNSGNLLEDSIPLTDQPEAGTLGYTELLSVGIIKIPKIRLSENIVQGVGNELYYGVGYVPDTTSPGQPGNCVLTGHRNYIRMRPFRYLDRLEVGDVIEISADGIIYPYKVYDTAVVSPEDNWVMQPQAGHECVLTLITCTPVLGMQDRLIVWAELQ